VVKLRLLANARYGSVVFIVLVVGAGLYCVAYLLPQFLAGIAGYNAEQSGGIMLLSGLPAFLMMPILPRLLGKVDARIMVILGLVAFAVSCMLDVGLTAQSVGHDFYASQLLRGIGQVMSMMPLNQASVASVSRAEVADAAGLFNMARNLGGSVGLALLGVYIDRRNAFHGAILHESLTANSTIGQERVGALTGALVAQHADPAYAQMQALGSIAGQMQQQASVITFSETFAVMSVVLLLCIPLAFLLGKPRPVSAAAAAEAGGH
jgi:DHA2 family multidrug resistance protein